MWRGAAARVALRESSLCALAESTTQNNTMQTKSLRYSQESGEQAISKARNVVFNDNIIINRLQTFSPDEIYHSFSKFSGHFLKI